MAREIEIVQLDLRYEGYRMRSPEQEKRLLASIHERGIDEPLEGVDTKGGAVLLDGFKRYRCAKKLGLGHVPYVSLGEDEVAGVLMLLRTSNRKGLAVLEQACFVDDLCRVHGMSVAQIAGALERSKSWVCMRLGWIGEMSVVVREKILSGGLSAYAYMATLRPFLRLDEPRREEVERFALAVSGKGLSVREIDQLAQGYFRGPAWFREAVEKGNLTLPLERIREVPYAPDGCQGIERRVLQQLDLLRRTMDRVLVGSEDVRPKTREFCAQAHLLAVQILARLGLFTRALGDLRDRTAKA